MGKRKATERSDTRSKDRDKTKAKKRSKHHLRQAALRIASSLPDRDAPIATSVPDPPAEAADVSEATGIVLDGAGSELTRPPAAIKLAGNHSKPWIRAQFEGEGKIGRCKHCTKSLSLGNTTRLKEHLFGGRCGFLASKVAPTIADPEVREALRKFRDNRGSFAQSTLTPVDGGSGALIKTCGKVDMMDSSGTVRQLISS